MGEYLKGEMLFWFLESGCRRRSFDSSGEKSLSTSSARHSLPLEEMVNEEYFEGANQVLLLLMSSEKLSDGDGVRET